MPQDKKTRMDRVAEEADYMDRSVGKVGLEEPAPAKKTPRAPHMWEALVSFFGLIAIMAVGIIVFEVDPHVPMLIGVILASIISLKIGYSWEHIETAMKDGIYRAMQAVIILMIVGVLIGVWIVAGVVPAMIYYGLKLLAPSIFLVAALLICSITSVATGTSWGTMGTMGLALMGIAIGLGIPEGMAAGAIISGAYFGDKMSPLSDTTNLAPAMAGTDVITSIKFMILPTGIAYLICVVVYAIMGFATVKNGSASTADIDAISQAMLAHYTINPLLLLPPLVVIVAVALKVPAIPGITLGIIAGIIVGLIFQPSTLGAYLDAGMNGLDQEWGNATLDRLLNSGGLSSMMFSVSLTILAMMFGGIMESTHQMETIVNRLLRLVKTPTGLVTLTEATCVFSNITMPEQYISLVVPGRMYAESYREMGLHPKTLASALESAGTVTSALVPWNTCAVYIYGALGVSTSQYFLYALFNWTTPLVTIALAFLGYTIATADGKRITTKEQRAKMKASTAAYNEKIKAKLAAEKAH